MKAKSFQIKALSSQLKSNFDAVLIYGPDENERLSVLSQIKQILGISSRSMNVITLTKDDLKKTPFLATDEANTTSLISERRFLFIPEEASFSVDALTHFMDNKKTDALLIIQGGNLTKTNALRLEAESHPRILAIICYQPSLTDMQRHITAYIQEHHKKIASQVLMELCKKISYNQDVIDKELDKLFLYLGDKQDIVLEDIRACLADNTEASLDEFCIYLADGQIEKTQELLTYYLAAEESETILLKVIRDYFELLLKIVSDTSAPVAQIVKKNLRPAQFRLELPLTRQARFWKKENILFVLDKLIQLEDTTRNVNYPKNTLILNTFLRLSLYVKKLSGLR